jgi:hypothetical protein
VAALEATMARQLIGLGAARLGFLDDHQIVERKSPSRGEALMATRSPVSRSTAHDAVP